MSDHRGIRCSRQRHSAKTIICNLWRRLELAKLLTHTKPPTAGCCYVLGWIFRRHPGPSFSKKVSRNFPGRDLYMFRLPNNTTRCWQQRCGWIGDGASTWPDGFFLRPGVQRRAWCQLGILEYHPSDERFAERFRLPPRIFKECLFNDVWDVYN